MSDHDHDHDQGAHEVDNMPSRRLFRLLFGLSGLTLLACIGVVQLFNQQVSSIRATRATQVSFQLAEYKQEMEAITSDWGVVVIDDDDGVPTKLNGKGPHEDTRYHMPLTEARKRVLDDPKTALKAARAYPNWVNVDPNAPKAKPRTRRPLGPRGAKRPGRQPVRVPAQGRPGAAPGRPAPGGAAVPGRPAPGGPKPGAAPAGVPTPAPSGKPPAEGKAPAKPAEGKAPAKPAEGKAPAKPAEGKAPAKPAEGKAQ